jgi:hypothetical protein
MPVAVTWDNASQSIISQQFSGRWTWDEFYRVTCDQTRHLMFASPHTVHVIADIEHDAYTTSMSGALTQVRNIALAYPENWGILVLVNTSKFLTILMDLFKRNHPDLAKRIFIAPTRDEAYTIIEQHENEWVAQ